MFILYPNVKKVNEKGAYILYPILFISIPSPSPTQILLSSLTTKVTVPDPSQINIDAIFISSGLTSGKVYGSGLGELFR
jgi:hypothetical protein